MININAQKSLSITLPTTNKALKNASPQELQRLSNGKDIASLLNDLTKGSLQNSEAQNKTLLALLQKTPVFKELGNIAGSIKDLLQTLQKDKNPLPLEKTLRNFLNDIQNMSEKELRAKIKDSGIFLESKMKNLTSATPKEMREMLSSDLKAILLKAKDEIQNATVPNRQEILKQIDKLTLQIDYHQLLSHLSNSTSLYLPYSWDALKEGNIKIKSAKDKKFFTDIELNLKKYGTLQLRLGLFEKNQLNINITTQNEELKSHTQHALTQLKKSLLDVGITPLCIRFLDESPRVDAAYSSQNDLDMGFEVKV